MFKVTDYLVQHQAQFEADAELHPLDTRGGGHVLGSVPHMAKAGARLLWDRLRGRLAGVHVNMAERASMVRKGLIVIWARALGIPVLIHLHAAQMHHVYREIGPALQALVRWVFSLAMEVLVLGEQSRRFAINELRCEPERVHVVRNGVPAPSQPRRPEDAGRPFHILFLGNLIERKGVADLLRAFTLMRTPQQQWRATLAGGGDVEGYRERAKALGLESQVHFFGWARQDEAGQLMADADALVLPSYDEGLPLVILEALARGVAVICTPVGEIPFSLTHEENALFVEPGNSAAIAEAIDRLIECPSLRHTLERRGAELYGDGFSMQAFFEAVASAHRRVFHCAASYDASGRSRGHGS